MILAFYGEISISGYVEHTPNDDVETVLMHYHPMSWQYREREVAKFEGLTDLDNRKNHKRDRTSCMKRRQGATVLLSIELWLSRQGFMHEGASIYCNLPRGSEINLGRE